MQQWCERAVLRDILNQLANTLREDGAINERESSIGATFAAAKGGATTSGRPAGAKASKLSRLSIAMGCRALRQYARTANHHEVTLVQLSFNFYMLEADPEHLIGDRA